PGSAPGRGGGAVATSGGPPQARSGDGRFLWCAAPGSLAIERFEQPLEALGSLLDPRRRGLAASGGFLGPLGGHLRAGRGLVGRILRRPPERGRRRPR